MSSSSEEAQLLWELFSADDFATSNGGKRITATTGMSAEDRSVMGPLLQAGKHAWDVTVHKTLYPECA